MKNANLKCPYCGQIQEVEIPKNQCLTIIECKKCKEKISTNEDECCVICKYADRKCSTKQLNENEENDEILTNKEHKVSKQKSSKKTSKSIMFKVVLIIFIFWFLAVATGAVYLRFFDSNIYHYLKEAKRDDNSAEILNNYQNISDGIGDLNEKDISNKKTTEKIEKLTQEVHNLQVLNPYYIFKEIKANAIPSGIPEGYGQELSVSFDDVQASINILAEYGPTYGKNKIELEGEAKERYIKIGMSISCEYCCGVDAIVKENGEAACGCAHSQAMRGLTAYLLQNYPDQYSDEKILDELVKWKTTYFPKQTIQKVLTEKKEAGEKGIEELLNEFPEFLPSMVGGC